MAILTEKAARTVTENLSATVLRHSRWLVGRMRGGARQKAVNLLAIAFVSVCIPWVIGTRLLGAFILIPLACLSVFLVADMLIDSFKGPAIEGGELAGKVAACILVGWSLGLSILLIEQNLGVATSVAERQLIMVGGEIAHETTAAELSTNSELQRRYLGVEPLAH